MRVTWNDLVVDRATIAVDGLLDSWRWLVDASCQVILIGTLGDLFVQNAIGQVFSSCWISRVVKRVDYLDRIFSHLFNQNIESHNDLEDITTVTTQSSIVPPNPHQTATPDAQNTATD
jgi:hypothetical protein